MKTRFLFSLSLLLILSCWGGISSNAANYEPVKSLPLKSSGVSTGKIEALVILIEFADRTAYFPPNEVDSFFNKVGFNKYHDNGSIHDYWAAVSQNRVDVHTNVTPTYFKAPKTFAYYDTEG